LKISMKKRAATSSTTATLARTTERFPVEGLYCASCAADLPTNHRTLPAIQAVNFNLAASEIAVTFDPARVGPTAIKQKLETLGLGCS
jgi:Cu2+-exporting ATPase